MTTVQESTALRPSRIWADSFRYAPSALVPAVTAAASSAVFTHLLTPSQYGNYGLALAIVGPMSTVLGQLVGNGTGRYYIEYLKAGRIEAYRQAVTWLVYATALVSLLLTVTGGLLVVGLTHSWDLLWLVLGSGCLVAVQAATTVLIPILSASFRPTLYSVVTSLAAVLSLASSWLLLWSLGHHAYGLTLGSALGQGIALPIILKHFPLSKFRTIVRLHEEAKKTAIRFITYGTPMVMWVAASSLMGLADRTMLELYHGSATVGVYGLNQNMAGQAVGLAIGPLITASWPILMQNWADNGAVAVENALAFFTNIYLMIGSGIVGVVAVIERPFEDILLGPRFTHGVEVLVPCLVAAVFWGAGRLGHSVLKLAQKTHLLALDALVAGMFNVVLNLATVPRLGMLGAAYSLIPSFALYSLLIWWQSRSIAAWRIGLKPTSMTIGLAVLGWALADTMIQGLRSQVSQLFLGTLIFSAVYVGGQLLLGPLGFASPLMKRR